MKNSTDSTESQKTPEASHSVLRLLEDGLSIEVADIVEDLLAEIAANLRESTEFKSAIAKLGVTRVSVDYEFKCRVFVD